MNLDAAFAATFTHNGHASAFNLIAENYPAMRAINECTLRDFVTGVKESAGFAWTAFCIWHADNEPRNWSLIALWPDDDYGATRHTRVNGHYGWETVSFRN